MIHVFVIRLLVSRRGRSQRENTQEFGGACCWGLNNPGRLGPNVTYSKRLMSALGYVEPPHLKRHTHTIPSHPFILNTPVQRKHGGFLSGISRFRDHPGGMLYDDRSSQRQPLFWSYLHSR